MGGRDLRVGGGAESEPRKRKRNRAVQQKKSCYAAKGIVLCGKEVVPFHKRSRAMREKVARFGEKVGVFPNKSHCLRKRFPIFLQPLGGSAGRLRLLVQQIAVIARKVGALARRTGFLELEGDDEGRHVSSLWKKGRVRDCLRGALLRLLWSGEERSALWAISAGEGVRPQRTRTNEKRRLHE